MPDPASDLERIEALRRRATFLINGLDGGGRSKLSGSAALGVLHKLASAPETAGEALTLLHELQVHQVEIEMQAEELRAQRDELEAALTRQARLYDDVPAGCFTIDRATVITALNLTGARLLGFERDALIGQRLSAFLLSGDQEPLEGVLNRAAATGGESGACDLRLRPGSGGDVSVHASVMHDPAGAGLCVALIRATGKPAAR